jgi:hypothetical protein
MTIWVSTGRRKRTQPIDFGIRFGSSSWRCPNCISYTCPCRLYLVKSPQCVKFIIHYNGKNRLQFWQTVQELWFSKGLERSCTCKWANLATQIFALDRSGARLYTCTRLLPMRACGHRPSGFVCVSTWPTINCLSEPRIQIIKSYVDVHQTPLHC